MNGKPLGRVIVLDTGIVISVVDHGTGEEVGFTHHTPDELNEGECYVARFGEFTICAYRESDAAFTERMREATPPRETG